MNTYRTYINAHKERFLGELFAFLRIPSISTLSSHQKDLVQAANFVKAHLLQAGADQAYLIEGKGNPLVYAEKIIDPTLPTILVYGHYDVQPVDPLDLWESPPFEPTLRNHKIYARGASDDKGQVYIHIKALECLHAHGSFPCNIKFLIEGEEEVGSEHIGHFLKTPKAKELLAADVVVVSDTTVMAMDSPSIDISLRGIVAFEVHLKGPSKDLHSGVYGGAVANPVEMLCRMVGQLKDAHGRISIPGFYDDVVTYTTQEREVINAMPFDLLTYKHQIGVKELFGEKGYTTPERLGIRPSLEVNGLSGGYTGEGIKTVLPAQATAKLTVRTVPHQDGQKVGEQLTAYLRAIAPKGVELSVTPLHGSGYKPFQTTIHGVGMQAASAAFEQVWGKRPHLLYQGASIPILSSFQEGLQTDVVNLGFGLESDDIHSPNEHFGVENFMIGIETILAFHQALAEVQKKALTPPSK